MGFFLRNVLRFFSASFHFFLSGGWPPSALQPLGRFGCGEGQFEFQWMMYNSECLVMKPIGSMYAIYGNIYHQHTPVMLAYMPAPGILWEM